MGKISNALKKVSEQRAQYLIDQKVKARKDFSEKINNKKMVKPSLNQEVQDYKPTLKDRFDSLRYGSTYIAREKDSTGIDPRIVTYFDDASSVAEQYRILRTNIKSYIVSMLIGTFLLFLILFCTDSWFDIDSRNKL